MNRDWLAVFEALRSVYTEGAYSNMAVNEALLHHKGCKESFVRNYAKGVLRDTIRLDYLIDRLAERGIEKIAKRPLIILRMGIYAIDCLDSVPNHAAVSEAVNLSKKTARGTDGFINGVLRSYLRRKDEFEIPEDRPDVKYSMNPAIISLIREQYADEAAKILEGLNEPPETVLRINRLRADREDVIAELRAMGIEAEASEDSPNAVKASGSGIVGSQAYKEGRISIQSLSSMMAIEAFSPKSGSSVLDLCAAPGGKSAYMAEIMGNRGKITACDIYEHRLYLVDKTTARLGIDIVETRLSDGTVFNKSMENAYDYVLADVPCSGLGVMAAKPEISFNSDPAEYDSLIEIQRAIAKNAVLYAKPGGRIEYSTCTLNKRENEDIIEFLLEGEQGSLLRVLEMRTLMPYNCRVGFFYCIMEKSPQRD
ncbi:MAG: 16S rRNA (cytosine(967)-C(5))-methyltransferase RsmB [Mogibacterium sp.]|nr:16S rRNA (cytosine(967)-C(5))-methyltransferase RsmB [Mogibacterium sp.]